jgi:hypothetical protein
VDAKLLTTAAPHKKLRIASASTVLSDDQRHDPFDSSYAHPMLQSVA